MTNHGCEALYVKCDTERKEKKICFELKLGFIY